MCVAADAGELSRGVPRSSESYVRALGSSPRSVLHRSHMKPKYKMVSFYGLTVQEGEARLNALWEEGWAFVTVFPDYQRHCIFIWKGE